MLIAVSVFVVGVVLWASFRIARTAQREIDAGKKDEKKQSALRWVFSSFHWIWAGVIPGAKYVYRAWKSAPPNSLEKFLWSLLLTAIAAIVLWIVLQIVDRIVNREDKPIGPPEEALIR